EELPAGGTTPLAHGLAAARRFVQRHRRRQPRLPIWTVLMTDGRTNVPLTSTDPWQDAVTQARALGACGSEFLAVDTEIDWPRFSGATQVAQALGARCLSLEEVLGKRITRDWRAGSFVSTAGINPAARQPREIAS